MIEESCVIGFSDPGNLDKISFYKVEGGEPLLSIQVPNQYVLRPVYHSSNYLYLYETEFSFVKLDLNKPAKCISQSFQSKYYKRRNRRMLRHEESAKAMRDTRLVLDSFESKSIIDNRRPIVAKKDYLDTIDYLY